MLTTEHRVSIPLPTFEAEVVLPLTYFGDQTLQPHVIAEDYKPLATTLEFEAQGGSLVQFRVRSSSGHGVHSRGGTIQGDILTVQMPAGDGYVKQTITLD